VPTVEQVLPVHDVKSWIWFKSRRIDAKVRGVHPDYFDKLRLKPILGRTLLPLDGQQRKRVCVVRARLLREAKYVGDPLPRPARRLAVLRVVGVLPTSSSEPNKMVLGTDDRALRSTSRSRRWPTASASPATRRARAAPRPSASSCTRSSAP
jgi:hypothetical protein